LKSVEKMMAIKRARRIDRAVGDFTSAAMKLESHDPYDPVKGMNHIKLYSHEEPKKYDAISEAHNVVVLHRHINLGYDNLVITVGSLDREDVWLNEPISSSGDEGIILIEEISLEDPDIPKDFEYDREKKLFIRKVFYGNVSDSEYKKSTLGEYLDYDCKHFGEIPTGELISIFKESVKNFWDSKRNTVSFFDT